MLNEKLYRAMTVLFKEPPKIINEGATASIEFPPPAVSFMPTVTKIPAKSIKGGEQYAVCCPYCNDKRYRLYVSHLWNVRIPYGGSEYVCSDSLIRCFNQECVDIRHPANRTDVMTKLNNLLGDSVALDMASVVTNDATSDMSEMANQVPLPDQLMDIMDPRVPDYTRDYWFVERRFSAGTLRDYGVKFTYLKFPIQAGAPVMLQPVTVIPVFQYGDYWFYQLRLIPINGQVWRGYECNQLGVQYPKYYIPRGARKSWCLYNLDEASKYQQIAIVEGTTDVWRLGGKAVAKFGRSLSAAQRGILQRYFAGKDLILVPDADDPQAMPDALKDLTMLNNMGCFRSVKISSIPAGMDPGDIKEGEDAAWRFILDYTDSQAGISYTLSGFPATL